MLVCVSSDVLINVHKYNVLLFFEIPFSFNFCFVCSEVRTPSSKWIQSWIQKESFFPCFSVVPKWFSHFVYNFENCFQAYYKYSNKRNNCSLCWYNSTVKFFIELFLVRPLFSSVWISSIRFCSKLWSCCAPKLLHSIHDIISNCSIYGSKEMYQNYFYALQKNP